MLLNFTQMYLDSKLKENENYIECTYYDLRVKHNLSEEQIKEFLTLSKNKLENDDFKVYFTGEKFKYQNVKRKVESNQYMVAIKEEKEDEPTKNIYNERNGIIKKIRSLFRK